MSRFACFDSDDNFIIFDYQYPRVSERFRAVVNGAPMVVHLSPCSVLDMEEARLCPGVIEENASETVTQSEVYIESVGDKIYYRSRNCPLVIDNHATGDTCEECDQIKTIRKVGKLHEPPKDDIYKEDDDYVDATNDFEISNDTEDDNEVDEYFDYTTSDHGDASTEENTVIKISREVKEGRVIMVVGDNFECDICYKVFKSNNALRQHLKWKHNDSGKFIIKQENKCQDCDKVFYRHPDLIKHALVEHGSELDKKVAFKGKIEKDLECPFCDEMFYSGTGNFASHVMSSHSDMKHTQEYKKIVQEIEEIVCSVCGESMTNQQVLACHMRNKHRDLLNLTEFCHICGKGFMNKKRLNIHMYIHNTGPSLCVHCGETFKNKISLQSHVRGIHSKKVFKCSEPGCEMTFKNSTKLRVHVEMVHLNLKKNYCDQCDKCFPSPHRLRLHISQFHEKRKPYACDLCDHKCSILSNLNSHRARVHKIEEKLNTEEYKTLHLQEKLK